MRAHVLSRAYILTTGRWRRAAVCILIEKFAHAQHILTEHILEVAVVAMCLIRREEQYGSLNNEAVALERNVRILRCLPSTGWKHFYHVIDIQAPAACTDACMPTGAIQVHHCEAALNIATSRQSAI